ncbi:hypothetical protein [Hydrogenophaga sp.]|uniref:hypothetical protein n=1 Tax=Hydrogenophaga sp. TaxID=1904254 RepID=UPI003AF6E7E5
MRGRQMRSAWATSGLMMLGVMAGLPVQAQDTGLKVDALRLEVGGFTDEPGASGSTLVHGALSLRGDAGDWSYALGARLDAHSQYGTQDFDRVRLDYTENYLRWQREDMRVTLGTQNVLWGRVDEISPTDRMSRVDFSRAVLDKLPERRRAVPAVRAEYFGEGFKLDGVLLPVFDEAVMPQSRSVWNPVDTVNGRILGIGSLPGIVGARVLKADINGAGGGGLRFTAEGDGFDYGFSVQRVRQSQPYYRVVPGAPVVLQAVHPFSTVLGAEFETERLGATWRMELAVNSAVPLTTQSFQYRTDPSLDFVIGAEFFPGDSETRVTLQLAGQRIMTNQAVLDRTRIYSFTGEIEHPFANGRWRADLRFAMGLNDRDLYINPRLSYTGIDRQEIYLAAHLFSGAANTLGGFYRRNDTVVVGWQGKF